MSQNESAVPEWVKKRSIEIEQEKQDRSKFYKFSKGETRILVDATKPPEQVEKFGGKTRYVYQITVNGEVKTLECGSMLDSLIVSALMKGINPMTVIRTGSGLDTQYGIKELD